MIWRSVRILECSGLRDLEPGSVLKLGTGRPYHAPVFKLWLSALRPGSWNRVIRREGV